MGKYRLQEGVGDEASVSVSQKRASKYGLAEMKAFQGNKMPTPSQKKTARIVSGEHDGAVADTRTTESEEDEQYPLGSIVISHRPPCLVLVMVVVVVMILVVTVMVAVAPREVCSIPFLFLVLRFSFRGSSSLAVVVGCRRHCLLVNPHACPLVPMLARSFPCLLARSLACSVVPETRDKTWNT